MTYRRRASWFLGFFSVLGCGGEKPPVSTAPTESETPTPLLAPVPPPAPAGKRPPCTLGQDASCNEDPSVSAFWGRCTELGVCECKTGFALNPKGRCQPE